MTKLRLQRALLACASAIGATASAQASVVTLDAYDSGYYSNRGATPDLNSIIEDQTRNNWFAFDLSSIAGKVTGAVLTILADGRYASGSTTSATYTLYDVSTDIGALTGGTGGAGAYTDLASGTIYGAASIALPNGGGVMPEVSVDLTGALDDINAALGGLFAMGGTSDLGANQYLWISSNAEISARLDLEVAPVPLPAALLPFGTALAGLGGLGALRRRSRAA
ncbi:hypothetical protein [Rhodovulum viride]|uniref:hypothetical protein n=1 Tax=Rhodovulum viride TaxID=1231134 RepID=UPI0011BFDD34|nr:hypothetical protein [Rhodovulum viride]